MSYNVTYPFSSSSRIDDTANLFSSNHEPQFGGMVTNLLGFLPVAMLVFIKQVYDLDVRVVRCYQQVTLPFEVHKVLGLLSEHPAHLALSRHFPNEAVAPDLLLVPELDDQGPDATSAL